MLPSFVDKGWPQRKVPGGVLGPQLLGLHRKESRGVLNFLTRDKKREGREERETYSWGRAEANFPRGGKKKLKAVLGLFLETSKGNMKKTAL